VVAGKQAIEAVFRAEGGRVLAALIGSVADFEIAEEALQDACVRALERWTAEGIPTRPSAWLTTVARRRAIDLLRRRRTAPTPVGVVPEAPVAEAEEPEEPAPPGAPEPADDLPDDRLRLLFTCCHPALAQAAQVTLALRTLCSLSTAEIARAFLEPEVTTAQRLVRAKKKIQAARIPYEVPVREQFGERLAGVLEVVYLVFNEGYTATTGESPVRHDLASEAIRLGRLLADLLPEESEARGLLALMLLHDSRRDTRVARSGEIVPLEEQDRSRWDRVAIEEGLAVLDAALAQRRPGPYQVQAAIAALHARAPRAQDTDWPQIAALYAGLLRYLPTAVVELNAAVALAMAGGPNALGEGLDWIERIEAGGELAGYYLLPAARADLLRRAGRPAEARAAYERALALATNAAERAYLLRRLAEVSAAAAPAAP
jgi:RNA polymerase sigma-70 factor, ECF subfamily